MKPSFYRVDAALDAIHVPKESRVPDAAFVLSGFYFVEWRACVLAAIRWQTALS